MTRAGAPPSGVGLAIFVKTPGLSPVKTRLAATIGAAAAEEFYRASVDCVRETAAAASGMTPYWAVAEAGAGAADCWSGFPVLPQGEGGLGSRLHRIYSSLLERHGMALLIGADSPQLEPRSLEEAAEALIRGELPFAMGRCEDGGFHLFGGTRPIDRSVWEGVEYSHESTSRELARALGGRMLELPAGFDVDTAEDLPRLKRELESRAERLAPAQRRLLRWLQPRLPSVSSA